MRRFLLTAVLLAMFGGVAHAQRDNTFYVKEFDGRTVADKMTNAQNECNASVSLICILILDSTLASYTEGTMPTRCIQCVWVDWRNSGLQTPVAHASNIQAAIDALPAAGGTVRLDGEYSITAAIDVGTKSVDIDGGSWKTTTWQAPFNDASWASAVTGTVIRPSGAVNCFNLATAAHYNSQLTLRNLACVGGGTGSGNGVSKSVAAFNATGVRLENVLIANFTDCVYLDNALYWRFKDVWLAGCDTGIFVPGAAVANELTFTNLHIAGATTAADIRGGQKWLVQGGMTEANTNGWLFAPTVALTHQSTIMGHWFESNTNYDFKVDSTNGAANGWYFIANRHSGTGAKFTFTGANATNNFSWMLTDAVGVDLTVPSTASNWIIGGGRFATITDNGVNTLMYGNPASKGDIRIGDSRPIQGKTGVGLIAEASGQVQIGRYGSANNGGTNIWGGFVQFGNAAASTVWGGINGSGHTYINNGFDLLGFSGNQTGQTFSMDAATGNVVTSGSVAIGNGTAILKHLSGTGTIDFASVAANVCNNSTITVTGAAVGDTVTVGAPSGVPVTNTFVTGFVSASNTVTVRLCNVATSASADPPSGTFRADVWQH